MVRNATLTETFAYSAVELLNCLLISEGNEHENSSLCLIKNLTMKACERVKVYRKAFLTSTRDESYWSVSDHDSFLKERKNPPTLPITYQLHLLHRIPYVLRPQFEFSGEEKNSLAHVSIQKATRQWPCYSSPVMSALWSTGESVDESWGFHRDKVVVFYVKTPLCLVWVY